MGQSGRLHYNLPLLPRFATRNHMRSIVTVYLYNKEMENAGKEREKGGFPADETQFAMLNRCIVTVYVRARASCGEVFTGGGQD